MRILLQHIGRLFRPGSEVARDQDLLIEDELIAAVGPRGSLDPGPEALEWDCGGALLTPGLIDAHTHPLYAAPRLGEIAERSEGQSYAEIAAAGGGISASVEAARRAPWEELERGLRTRLRGWLEGGTTTMEAKSGYWLEREGELHAVALLRQLGNEPDLPELVVTFLGAHSLPPEYRERRSDYIDEVASWLAAAREAGAKFCDVFCDQGAFTVEESRRLLVHARGQGLRVRLHADELALTGGTRLAVELGADSADHLLAIGEDEVAVLAGSSTVATLCPVTALSMGQLPPARRLAEAGVSLALGSDHNPGTSGVTSMATVVWLAINELGLSVSQALGAATLGGARSLGLADRSCLKPGQVADLVLWPADHEGAFAWTPDLRPTQVWHRGRRS